MLPGVTKWLHILGNIIFGGRDGLASNLFRDELHELCLLR